MFLNTKKQRTKTKMDIIRFCRSCASVDLIPFLNLGFHPLANQLLSPKIKVQDKYPLSLSFCKHCKLVQLNETINPKILFSHYVWVTETSQTAKKFAVDFFNHVIKRHPIISSYVLEVGSNDGTFLMPFKKKKIAILGMDPAQNIVSLATKKGIPTLSIFFTTKEAKKMVKKRGKASVVIARNVLPHVANTVDFVNGLATVLDQNGLAVIEVHYSGKIMKELHYDSIYHEHLCYFSLYSLEKLLKSVGLFIFDIAKSPISGGSLIVFAKKEKKSISAAVKRLRIQEEKLKLNQLRSWQSFARSAAKHRKKLMSLMRELNKKKHIIIGYGASARSATLLNYCGLISDDIIVIADKNPLKQGLRAPGSYIPIVKPKIAMSKNPTVVVLLAWNFADEIKTYLQNEFGFKGRFIHPLPNYPKIAYATKKRD